MVNDEQILFNIVCQCPLTKKNFYVSAQCATKFKTSLHHSPALFFLFVYFDLGPNHAKIFYTPLFCSCLSGQDQNNFLQCNVTNQRIVVVHTFTLHSWSRINLNNMLILNLFHNILRLFRFKGKLKDQNLFANLSYIKWRQVWLYAFHFIII